MLFSLAAVDRATVRVPHPATDHALGISDLARAKAFYGQLGWRGQEVQETACIQAGGLAVVLRGQPRHALPADVYATVRTIAA